MATTTSRGMRDHTADFNKSVLESVPASWIVRADGRPRIDPLEEEKDKEGEEDAVCMCCFDGSSLEGNRIMFCDGCNAAVHQVTNIILYCFYGIISDNFHHNFTMHLAMSVIMTSLMEIYFVCRLL